MSNHPHLPHDNEPFTLWLARHTDLPPHTRTGPRWRSRLLHGRTLADLMAERPLRRKITVEVDVDELSTVSHHVLASGLSRHAWIRRAIAHYLVHVNRVDRETIPGLCRDLP